MSKHTPGPYFVTERDTIISNDLLDPDKGTIAAVRVLGGSPEKIAETRANAHLFAAAPDMLAALEETITRLRTGAPLDAKWKQLIVDAVAKAKGGTS